MNTGNRPIKNCYWVSPGLFLAGEYPRNKDDETSRDKLQALISFGVSAFIDLTEENEGLSPYEYLVENITHHRFPIRDISIPNSSALTESILDTIDTYIKQERMVYLHCWGGVGRTGTIVGCWLARHGFKGKDALERLNELWNQCPKSAYRSSPETKEQIQYVLKWEETK